MQDGLLVAIFGIIGVVIGVLLNEIATFLRQRREDKRKLKVVLFGLLDVHFHIVTINPDSFLTIMRRWIESQQDNKISEEQWGAVSVMLKDFVGSIFASLKPPLDDRVIQIFDSAVRDLAAVDPFLAFTLSDRTRFDERLSCYRNSVNEFLHQWESATSITQSGDWLPHLETVLKSQLCAVIEDDIREVSRRVGWYTWWRACQYIKRQRIVHSEKLQEDFNTKMNEIIKSLDQT